MWGIFCCFLNYVIDGEFSNSWFVLYMMADFRCYFNYSNSQFFLFMMVTSNGIVVVVVTLLTLSLVDDIYDHAMIFNDFMSIEIYITLELFGVGLAEYWYVVC